MNSLKLKRNVVWSILVGVAINCYAAPATNFTAQINQLASIPSLITDDGLGYYHILSSILFFHFPET